MRVVDDAAPDFTNTSHFGTPGTGATGERQIRFGLRAHW
jgi:hypothetical protein